MQLNITTDYAVRVILMLSAGNRQIPASELAQALCIPPNYLMKVLRRLKSAGLISSKLGVNGGYRLEMPAEEITFQMIFEAMGDTIILNRCLETQRNCSHNTAQTCPVHAFYNEIQEDVRQSLCQYQRGGYDDG